MTKDSFLERTVGHPLGEFTKLTSEQRGGIVRAKIPDLHFFFDEGRSLGERTAPRRTLDLAQSLFEALVDGRDDAAPAGLAERIVTDSWLRQEADRDQNVYLGGLFTRTLTQAVPDLIFLPVTAAECAVAFAWAKRTQIPITLRGAASTAMGGSVPNDGGLTLDVSRLDLIEIDPSGQVAVIGAGARLRTIHKKLADRGLALGSYPSNLGGTLVGWFVTGGIGLNAFGRGRALDAVRVADVLLPSGEHVRFHDDGRLDVPEDRHRRTLPADEAKRWFETHGYAPLALADLAGSEGALGLVLQVTVRIEPRRENASLLLSFESEAKALEATAWVCREAGKRFGAPANVKLFSASHLHHVRRVWKDEAAKEWKRLPSALSSGEQLPWTRILDTAEIGARTAPDDDHAGGYLWVDFNELDAARAFVHAVGEAPGSPRVLAEESVRIGAERFKPQQTKRLGPGLLAAEIVMPAAEVATFLPAASALARAAGNELDAEAYFLADGSALVIAGYLTDHRRGSMAMDLVLAPALLDLAMARHHGRPYVLGRWQAAYFGRKFGASAARLRDAKRRLDPSWLLNRGVLIGFQLRGALGALVATTMVPGVSLLRSLLGLPGGALLGRGLRGVMSAFPGPAAGRGAPAEPREDVASAPVTPQVAAARALHCVNCGECNTVCPIFHESKIRLPQMLTHLGEASFAGETVPATGSALLDLCMRCGNCEEVCQAGIPHLPIYEQLQKKSNEARPYDRERHVAILASVRGSQRYQRDFLELRPGGYIKRTPASLPGMARFLLFRSENDAGPAATCLHCGGCVSVCPTGANKEFEGDDPRWITTDQHRCIGCGTCVEVCPANHLNGGQTLRVMEAPTRDWFIALEEFEKLGAP